MAITKINRYMYENNIIRADINKNLISKGYKPLTKGNLSRIMNGKTFFSASLKSCKSSYPSTLERLCIGLGCKSSDILDY